MNPLAAGACEPAAFEQRYRLDEDPWQFASSAYERERYAVIIESLTRDRYANAFEPGCSIGELTALLAPLCDRLLATDVSPTAVEKARQRCAGYDNVRVECGDVRTTALDSPLDLIVLSELAYYFEPRQLEALSDRLAAALSDDGTFLAVHWLGESADHILHGDEAHEILLRRLPLRHMVAKRYVGFRLDLWRRA
jgi:protein-L-isoaspartate O-methyltransferase